MAILLKRAVHIPELREVKPRSTRKNVIKLYIFGNKNKITDKKKPMKKTLLSTFLIIPYRGTRKNAIF